MNIHEINSETSYINDPIAANMATGDVDSLIEKYRLSPRRRHRFCFHQNPAVDLHDIIICYDNTSYIPPNKHIGKVESLLVLSGTLDFYLFNDSGQLYDYRRLSTPSSGRPFYIRVPPNTWHGLRAVGNQPCVIKETISGPYDRNSLLWAGFAPKEEEGADAGFEWYDKVDTLRVAQGIDLPEDETFERVSETVFRSSRQLVTVTLNQLMPIIEAAHSSELKRARLCCHWGAEDKLQEMFIALAYGVNIDESMHIRKDESLTVISGTGKYVFPNEDGSERAVYPLGPYGPSSENTEKFFARINRYVPHKINVDSKFMLIHESTSGPFNKSDTDYRIRGAI